MLIPARRLVFLSLLVALLAPAALASPAKTAAKAAPAKAAAHSALPWIDDDYPHALAVAKARKVPIFVESWAPW